MIVTHQNYKITQQLGKGGQGIVFKANAESSGDLVAIKLSELSTETLIYAFMEEMRIVEHLKKSKVQNICQVHEMKIRHSSTASGGITVMKSYDCDLFTHAIDNRRTFDPASVQKIFRQVCNGVKSLHHAGVAHTDLKPENVLMDIATQNVAICDFGSCVWMKKRRTNEISGARGTNEYYAPEMIESEYCYDPFKVDSFCLGVLLFILLTGTFPYSNNDHICDYDANELGFSPEVENLLAALLNPDPLKRISVSEALKHPWLSTKSKATFGSFISAIKSSTLCKIKIL